MNNSHDYKCEASYVLFRLIEDEDFMKLARDKRKWDGYSSNIYREAESWYVEYKAWLKDNYEFVNEKARERYEIHMQKKGEIF